MLTAGEMLGIDGCEAARKIRQREPERNNKATPIDALSADTLVEQVEHCYTPGMDGHLSKPMVFEDLNTIRLKVAGGGERRA
jgi:CheY-like chemotaxis protein